MPKVIVVGLDGATWDLLKPWADEGELTALKKLMGNGVWGVLESTVPPLTGPAWTSLLTGRNPGKHGIFGFAKLVDNSARLYTANDVRSRRVYELLSEEGLRSILISIPLSFPPSRGFRGIMISDFLHHAQDVFPQSKRRLMEDYRVLPDLSLRGDAFLDDAIDTLTCQVEVAKRLFAEETWDFYFAYLGMTDTILHQFWNDVVNNNEMGKKAKRVFAIADHFLQWLVDHMDAKTTLLLVSDHGFGPCPFQINLNSLFMHQGLLRTKTRDANEPSDETLWAHMNPPSGQDPGKTQQGTEEEARTSKDTGSSEIIDYANSTAFVLSGCVSPYIGGVNAGERETIRQQIAEQLRALEYSGRRVLAQVFLARDVYSGPFLEFAPDILLVPNGFLVRPGLGREVYSKYAPGGGHVPEGIFLAYGSGIAGSGVELQICRIYDIAPTILHIFGLPVPIDMDGRVLREIFQEGTALATQKTTYRKAEAAGQIERKGHPMEVFEKAERDSERENLHVETQYVRELWAAYQRNYQEKEEAISEMQGRIRQISERNRALRARIGELLQEKREREAWLGIRHLIIRVVRLLRRQLKRMRHISVSES